MQGVSRGLVAEGLTNIAGSFINGVTQTPSGGAVGLTQASGITSRIVAFVLDADWPQRVNRLSLHLGHEWAARPEVVARLDHATNELIDTIVGHHLIDGEQVRISTRFDEYGCKLKISYEGTGVTRTAARPGGSARSVRRCS